MSRIISVHSFRGGTGKSNTTANLAYLCAAQGLKVGVVDTDIQSPGIHVLFGLDEDSMENGKSLNDYLWGKCAIEETAHDVTPSLGDNMKGRVFLIPSSIKAGEIARVLREGYDVGLLNDGFEALIKKLGLDLLMIDTHPGLSEETLLSIAISDVLVLILRPDQQDYQGTSVTVEVARKLDVPKMFLMVNKVPEKLMGGIKQNVEAIYDCEVAAVIPHSDDLMTLASSGVFSSKYPDHPVTKIYQQLVKRILAE
ncbi:MAG: MinD/ParA family protein [Chloroflexi bacterium]|jgi:MinD-like ATPase involved in chromosome partitioning or flagellar assembly|nr:MinD/ParA family protein [Chloroflexota bacterium]